MGVSMPGSTDSLPNYQTIEYLKGGQHKVEVKYIDTKSQESPVYKFDLDLKPLRLNYMGSKVPNPKTGKAGSYVYYNFYDSKVSAGADVSYSIDSENYDQKADGMIMLDSVNPGKHQVNVRAKLNNQEIKESIEVEVS